MKRHQKICLGKTEYKFPGGFYSSPKTVFDKLEQQGIRVPPEERLFEWFLVYDFEAILQKVQNDSSPKLQWTHQHLPISVSLCSNVDQYTQPHCIIEPEIETLVQTMVDYMTRIADRSHQLARDKFASVFEELDYRMENIDGPLDLEELAEDQEWMQEREKMQKTIEDLKTELDDYCRQIVCLGFNSANYDINLVKTHLAKHLGMHDGQKVFTIKRNNQYACLSTERFKILDITQYLAAGTNYASFLKAFDVSEAKGFFPYEWFDSVEKLEYPCLPPHTSFYSSLKQSNISEEDYAFCRRVWDERGMTRFRYFLEWYNNNDVKPFVEAVTRLQRYYFDRGIDMFKVSVSVPGLSRLMLFESGRKAGAAFALFDTANSDLYKTIKQNIVGGPSIIFHRFHEKNVTCIRGNPQKKCQKILGFDANALYLYCLDQPMPTGPFVRRRLENNFQPQKRDRYMLMFHWMNYLNHTHGCQIQHKLNTGKEKKIGPYPVDGYDETSDTVYQFQGCYFHGHSCWLTKAIKDQKWLHSKTSKYKKTQNTTRFLRSRGHTVIEMWECDFRHMMQHDQTLKKYLERQTTTTPQRKMTEEEILREVIADRLFGMVEVDIRVPDVWPQHFHHSTLSPYDYFQEMAPFFCTTDVPYQVIGDHMQDHVRRFDLSKKPRRLLVGGMMARQLLIATPLLKWYLQHGLQVTKIYQVVEYTPQRCFHDFVQEVSDDRRKGDLDPNKAILADTAKIRGNSAYGSTIMDQEKFQDIHYVQGEGKAMLQANLPQFKKLTTLLEEQEYFEIEKAKPQLTLSLPIQIGYFILQYAKLHMLQFYYDFLDKFLDRSDFQYCEMDTDSAYLAISAPRLTDIIKPDMVHTYLKGLNGYCHDHIVEADANLHWFPRTCCLPHSKYDRRTPGLFKLEYEGDTMIGLCSKTYIVQKTIEASTTSTAIAAHALLRRAKKQSVKRLQSKQKRRLEVKFSSKGVNKRRVKAPMTTFRRVLTTQRVGHGTIQGFRSRNNGIYTYKQTRNGFSYFYCKRRVLDDGVSTVPLDLELGNKKNKKKKKKKKK